MNEHSNCVDAPEVFTVEDGDEGFRLSASPAHLLRRVQQFTTEIFGDLGLSDDLTLRQSVVLAAIAENPGLSQSDLVAATGIDRSTLAEMVRRMEDPKKGLIVRAASEDDARAKSVTLTKKGRKTLDEALPAMMTVDESLLTVLPRNRRNAFVDVLTLLAAAAAAREPAQALAAAKQKKDKHKTKAKDKDKARKKKKAKA